MPYTCMETYVWVSRKGHNLSLSFNRGIDPLEVTLLYFLYWKMWYCRERHKHDFPGFIFISGNVSFNYQSFPPKGGAQVRGYCTPCCLPSWVSFPRQDRSLPVLALYCVCLYLGEDSSLDCSCAGGCGEHFSRFCIFYCFSGNIRVGALTRNVFSLLNW